jgi:hypothetical protein
MGTVILDTNIIINIMEKIKVKITNYNLLKADDSKVYLRV